MILIITAVHVFISVAFVVLRKRLYMKCFTSTAPMRRAIAKSCYIQLMFPILKKYLKNIYDNHFRRIFSSDFQRCSQFFRNFPFSRSKIQNALYLKKCIFNIFFYPLDESSEFFTYDCAYLVGYIITFYNILFFTYSSRFLIMHGVIFY